MSRSRKSTPYSGEKKDRYMKRYANKKLRRKKLTHDLQHKSYKKVFCTYDICDYYWIETTNFEEYYKKCVSRWYEHQNKWCYKNEPFPTKEKCWEEYQKRYIRK